MLDVGAHGRAPLQSDIARAGWSPDRTNPASSPTPGRSRDRARPLESSQNLHRIIKLSSYLGNFRQILYFVENLPLLPGLALRNLFASVGLFDDKRSVSLWRNVFTGLVFFIVVGGFISHWFSHVIFPAFYGSFLALSGGRSIKLSARPWLLARSLNNCTRSRRAGSGRGRPPHVPRSPLSPSSSREPSI